jgi:hypothetical protein
MCVPEDILKVFHALIENKSCVLKSEGKKEATRTKKNTGGQL